MSGGNNIQYYKTINNCNSMTRLKIGVEHGGRAGHAENLLGMPIFGPAELAYSVADTRDSRSFDCIPVLQSDPKSLLLIEKKCGPIKTIFRFCMKVPRLLA